MKVSNKQLNHTVNGQMKALAELDKGAQTQGAQTQGISRPSKQADLPDDSAGRQVTAERAQAFAQGQAQPVNPEARSIMSLRAEAKANKALAKTRETTSAEADTLASVVLWSSTPGRVGTAEAPEKAFSLSGADRTLSTTTRLGGEGASGELSAYLDRAGFGADVTRHGDGVDRSAGIWVMKDWGMASASATRENADGTADRRSVGAFLDPTGGGLYAGLSHRLTSGNSLGIWGFLGGDVDRSLSDLGAYKGDDPARKGFRAVELKRSLSGFVVASPSLHLESLFGIGGRLSVNKGSALSYTTYLPADEARAQLFEPGGKVSNYLRNRARAFKLKDEPLLPPDLSKPEQIAVGDRLRLTTNGEMSGGLLIGPGFGAYVGAQGGMRGEFAIDVHRPDATHLEVEVIPTRVDMVQILGRALVLDATAGRARAQGMAQRFRFDMTQPEARAAYQALLQGQLPGGGDAKKVPPSVADQPSGADFKLPAGVQGGPVEVVQGRSTRLHGDIGFSLLTLGATRSSDSYERRVSQGDVQLRESIRSLEKRSTIPLSGDEDRGVRGVLARSSQRVDGQWQDEVFAGLDLVAFLNDSKARGLELNDDIDDFNEAFGLKINHFTQPSLKEARGIELHNHLAAADLQALSKVDDPTARDAAEASGVRVASLLTLLRGLGETANPIEQATLVQDFVGRHGIPAMGALSRLLPPAQLSLSTSLGALDKLTGEADTLAFKYPKPIAADDDNSHISTRFKETFELDEKLGRLRALVLDDPLLKQPEREAALKKISMSRNGLRNNVRFADMSVAQRQALIDQLEAGWTTSWERRAIEALEQIQRRSVKLM